MKSIYWVGPRQSDIEDIKSFFAGSVTIYGNNQDGNIAYCSKSNRINHNIDNIECDQFIEKTLNRILENTPYAQFLFYNQEHAYQYSEKIIDHAIGQNECELLEMISDKARCRLLLSDIVNTIPFVTLKGFECIYENICKYFTNATEFVVQKIFSSGGDGTNYIDASTSTLLTILQNPEQDFLVSPYITDAISLNIHIVVYTHEILTFPASMQIVNEINNKILYSGADFICYETLSEDIKQTVNSNAIKIGKFLQNKGYRGILGIDFLLKQETLYFMEINPRFQASSELLNRALCSNGQNSLQEFHIKAFSDCHAEQLDTISVNYSNFAYTTQNISPIRIQKIYSSPEVADIQTDGYHIQDIVSTDDNIYLFRSIFSRNICTISHGKLLLHPNIYVEDIKKYLFDNTEHYKEYVKIALLNHGITMSENATTQAQKLGQIKEAVFDAIDISIYNSIAVNVPTTCKFVSLSPFTIDIVDSQFVLLCDGIRITNVEIDFIPEALIDKKTSSGVPFDSIINLATDRIRINPAPICVYKTQSVPCKFCNLPEQNLQYNFDDIKEVIDYCLENVTFRHFLIGGGTYSLNGGWEIILKIIYYIRSKSSKDIYLMSIPPENVSILDSLKAAGITEVAFNLEMFDRELAKKIMPGKGTIPLSQYLSAFNHSVKLWGRTGSVRTLLIYGLDTEKDFLFGIEHLCQSGVEPIISIFRPLANTDVENWNPPMTLDIFSIYEKCKSIASRYSLILGPDCAKCQNNTLSYTEKSN